MDAKPGPSGTILWRLRSTAGASDRTLGAWGKRRIFSGTLLLAKSLYREVLGEKEALKPLKNSFYGIL